MSLDPERLTAVWRKSLQTPSGRRWLEQVGTPGWLLLIVSSLQLICGWCLLFTIVLLPRGVRWIISGITFRPYRESLRQRLVQRQSELEVYPACAIIRGPSGAALVLGSASPIELETLTDLAGVFGGIYTAGSVGPGSRSLQALLRDDDYQPHRRRRVPPQNSLGHDLWLFDIVLDLEQCGEFEGQPILAVGVLPQPDGVHVQMPWDMFSAEFRQPSDRSGCPELNLLSDLRTDEASAPTATTGSNGRSPQDGRGLFPAGTTDAISDEELFGELFRSPESPQARASNVEDELWSESDAAPTPSRPVPDRSQSIRSIRDTVRSDHTGEESDLSVSGRVWARAADVTVLGALGLLLLALFPALAGLLLAAFVAGAVLLLGASWALAVRHALIHQNRPIALVIFPWTSVSYSIHHWPQTWRSLNLLTLFFVWTIVPVLLGPPLTLLVSLFASPFHQNPGPGGPPIPAAPVAVNAMEVVPHDPNVFPIRLHRQSRNGTITTTVTWSDQTSGTFVRQSLTGGASKFDYENYQKNSKLALWLLQAKVGDSQESLVHGTEQEFIYGGQAGIYTVDSPPGAVAVHAGVVRVGESVRVRVTVVTAPHRYPMLEQHGIISFPKSPQSGPGYRIEKVEVPETAEDSP